MSSKKMEEMEKCVQGLCDYIQEDRALQGKLKYEAEDAMVYHNGNMGAIIADTILQRGNPYETIVLPAAQYVETWDRCSMPKVRKYKERFKEFFGFGRFRFHNDYPRTFCELLGKIQKGIKTAKNVKEWMKPSYKWLSLSDEYQPPQDNEELPTYLLMEIYGVDHKTADYFYQRCGGDILIPDTHVREYFNRAPGCKYKFTSSEGKYYCCQKIGTDVAVKLRELEKFKKLKISPRKLDSAIWHLMKK